MPIHIHIHANKHAYSHTYIRMHGEKYAYMQGTHAITYKLARSTLAWKAQIHTRTHT